MTCSGRMRLFMALVFLERCLFFGCTGLPVNAAANAGDPAPGRSPGPPVESTPLVIEQDEEKCELEGVSAEVVEDGEVDVGVNHRLFKTDVLVPGIEYEVVLEKMAEGPVIAVRIRSTIDDSPIGRFIDGVDGVECGVHVFKSQLNESPLTLNWTIEVEEDVQAGNLTFELDYQMAGDSTIYKTSLSLPVSPDSEEYDFIIIGAGASGTVLANRLSEESSWKILVLEAGNFGNDITDMPNMALSVRLSDYNWGFKSVRQTTCCLDMPDQKCIYPRGQGVGGTTLLNGLVYARGSKIDYDTFAKNGNLGWSYEEVLPFFKKSENFVKTDPGAQVEFKYHGEGGYLTVDYPVPRQPLITTWLQANEEKGYKIVDYNGQQLLGASIAQLNTEHGKREHGGNAFIKPIIDRPNLTILTGSYVTKIDISEITRTARGVHFVRRNRRYFARCKKEVILSAGTFNSPQTLMLSGIGPSKHLRQLGIKPIKNLPVGSNLRDHTQFHGLVFDSNFTKDLQPLGKYIEEYLNGTGSLTLPINNAGLGFYQTKLETEKNYPDLEIMMVPGGGVLDLLRQKLRDANEKFWLHLDQSRSFLLNIIALHSKSSGTLRLKSSDPFDYPLIDSRFLSDAKHRDIDTLYEGIRIVLNLIDTPAFAKINAKLFKQDLPACRNESYLSKGYWYCALRHWTSNVYHPFGTCPMGVDPKKGAVVDNGGRVHGIMKLRVADASIVPGTFSGHPNAICVLIGEKISQSIKEDHKAECESTRCTYTNGSF